MGTENNNLPARQYEKQYKQLLSTVFDATKAFRGVLAPIQIEDGVQQNATAFSVKTNNTPVVVGTYDTNANTAFGTGTGKGSRFGELKEVIYSDTDVPYDYTLTIHEGIDRFTVNNDLDAAVADRLKLHSEAETRDINKRTGKFLSTNAGKTEALADLKEITIQKLFNAINIYKINSEINAPLKAYLRPQLYNAIIDMLSTNSSKGSKVSVDGNEIYKYKGFVLEETAEQYFENNVAAIFAPDSIVIPFVGIETARVIPTEDFDGVKLQAAAKGGTFALDDNKKAIIKVTSAGPLA